MKTALRPRFRLRVDLAADDVMQLVETARPDLEACELRLFQHQVEVRIRAEDRHFWSPFLNLIVEEYESGSTLRGKYGPNVNVWTMFLAGYAACVLTGSVGVVVGVSQSTLGMPTWGYTVAIVCAVTTALLYVAGRMGRALAHPQMVVIHEVIEGLFADHILELHDDETD